MMFYFSVKSCGLKSSKLIIAGWSFFKRLAAKLEKQFLKTFNVDIVSILIISLTLRAFVLQNNVLLGYSRDFRAFKSL